MNRKKAGMIAAAVMLPVTTIAGSVAFFFTYAVVRMEKKKKKKKRKKAPAAPKEGEGLTFDCFRDKMEEGTRWFKEQDPEKITLTSYDGLKLSAYLLPAEKKSRNVLLLMHGYRCDGFSDFSCLYQFYHDQGYHMLVPHQRSHAEIDGKYICFGVKERYDCKMWADYAVRRFGSDCNLYLSGISMGSSTVLMAAGLDLPSNVRGIIADCGFTSPYDIFRHVLNLQFRLPSFPLMNLTELAVKRKAGFDYKAVSTLDVLKTCKIPVLFIHGGKDDFVPTQMTLDNYSACASPKELLIVPEAGHGTSNMAEPERYRETALAFMKKYEK